MDWDIPWFLPLGGGVISVLVLHLMCTTEPSLQLKTQSVSLHSDSRIWKWSGAARRGCIIVVRNARQEGLSEGNQPNTVVYLIDLSGLYEHRLASICRFSMQSERILFSKVKLRENSEWKRKGMLELKSNLNQCKATYLIYMIYILYDSTNLHLNHSTYQRCDGRGR